MAEQREVLRIYLNGSTRNLLLVIDNMWKADDWNQLLAAEDFRRGGCKVIVTRDESIARTMGVTHFHRVKCLNGDDGWLLLHKMANLGETGQWEHSGCWKEYRAEVQWPSDGMTRDNIDMAYMELKYRLKRCFLYCSLYPEDFVIKQQCVTQKWISEGFFEGSENLEEEAGRCYHELIERGLLLLENEANSDHGWTLEELRALCNLTSLQILKLGRTSSIQDARQSGLQELYRLRELELCCSSVDQLPVDQQEHIKDVLDTLKPAQNLSSLKLDGYYGNEFPSWFSVSHLTQLQRLTLDSCFHCQRIPPLGEMMRLQSLAITGFSVLTDINELRGEPATGVGALG
ncbi:hypothetical protein ACQ4PT_037424 [Festuca glaucescens]